MKKLNYFEVKASSEIDVIGNVYPQCNNFLKGVDLDAPNSFWATDKCLDRQNKFPDFKPELDGFKLAGGAKLTDFLSVGAIYHAPFANKKALDVLAKLNIPDYRIYPGIIYRRLKPLQYYLPCILDHVSEHIIWPECVFYRAKLALANANLNSIYDQRQSETYTGFESREDFSKFNISLKTSFLVLERLVVDNTFDTDVDLFFSSRFEYFASDRFKAEIEQNGITGLEFPRTIEVFVKD